MTISVPNVVIAPGAPDHTQHLTTDVNGAFARLAADAGADISAVAADLVALSDDVDALITSGTWTPVFTFATPGDLAFTYANQVGTYVKVGSVVFLTFQLTLTGFTHTTASGSGLITGAPFPVTTGVTAYGNMGLWNGFTFGGGQTALSCQVATVASVTNMTFVGSGSGVAAAGVDTAVLLSGTNKTIRGSVFYPTP